MSSHISIALRRTGTTAAFALAALSVVAVMTPATISAQGNGGARMNAGAPAQPPASPRDSLTATIGGSTITVNYGRPSKRGRVIFNGLPDMKWGMVWRAGANEATHFTTTKALAFGNEVVPAGTYTLFTKLVENGNWELIINKQTKQWGTAYDASQDLVHIPMTVTSNNPVKEMMEITVTPAGHGGALTITWDNYKAVADFTVR